MLSSKTETGAKFKFKLKNQRANWKIIFVNRLYPRKKKKIYIYYIWAHCEFTQDGKVIGYRNEQTYLELPSVGLSCFNNMYKLKLFRGFIAALSTIAFIIQVKETQIVCNYNSLK